MNTKTQNTKEILSFKKWTNKSWGIFNSLSKYVKILMLSLSYFLISTTALQAQKDTVSIEEIEIQSYRTPILINDAARIVQVITKNEIAEMPVHSIQDLLENISGVDIRQRGQEGVQADISTRGGTFEQTLILVNGFKMNDSQTGHHNMNLPVDISTIERIEILEGAASRIFGTNAYSGAINIITNNPKSNKIKIAAYGGEYMYFGKSASISHNYKSWQNFLSISDKSSDGYLSGDSINNTDFNILNIFYSTNFKFRTLKYTIQAGYTEKNFGANSFYSPKFPYQYENTKTIFAGYKAVKKTKYFEFLKSFYWRQNNDRFELFREDIFNRNGNYFITENKDTAKYYPNIYESWNYYGGHNFHRTNSLQSELKFNFKTKLGKTAIGATYGHTWIKSNVLGVELDEKIPVKFEELAFFTKGQDRYNVNLYIEQAYSYKKFDFSGGYSANYNKMFNWNYSGGADVAFKANKNIRLSASVNEAIRLPSFTDLYYQGATNIGNDKLMPEKSITYEFITKYFNKNISASVNVFHRKGKNTIDWVKIKADDKWQAMNIVELETTGFQANSVFRFSKNSYIRNIRLSYTFLDVQSKSGLYISHYAMDYLKHKATFSLNHKIYNKFSASWQVSYQDRNGTYSIFDTKTASYTGEAEYKPFILADAKILWRNKYVEVYAEATNFLDTEYQELGNLRMPGRWLKAGVIINFDYGK